MQASTGYTPFYLMFGREARLPVDIMFGSRPSDDISPNHYALQLQDSLSNAYRTVHTNMAPSHHRQKDYYDKHLHGKPLTKGDLVWLLNTAVPPGQSCKLHCPWKTTSSPTTASEMQMTRLSCPHWFNNTATQLVSEGPRIDFLGLSLTEYSLGRTLRKRGAV